MRNDRLDMSLAALGAGVLLTVGSALAADYTVGGARMPMAAQHRSGKDCTTKEEGDARWIDH